MTQQSRTPIRGGATASSRWGTETTASYPLARLQVQEDSRIRVWTSNLGGGIDWEMRADDLDHVKVAKRSVVLVPKRSVESAWPCRFICPMSDDITTFAQWLASRGVPTVPVKSTWRYSFGLWKAMP